MGFRGRNLTTLMMKMSKEHSKSKKSNRSPKSLADAAISEGRWESAVKFLSRAIEQDPGDHTLYLKRAKAYMEMGNFRFAIFAQPDAQRSCMIEPDQVEGYILFSKAAIANQELWGAEIGVRKGLLVNPTEERLVAQLERVQQARKDPSMRPETIVVPVYDFPDKLAFLHTHGLHWDGLPELLMVDVPPTMLPASHNIMDSISSKLKESEDIAHGDIIEVEGQLVQVLKVSEEVNRASLINMVGMWNMEAEVTILKLLGSDESAAESADRDTLIPPAPDGNEALLKKILDDWRQVESFTFLVGGEQANDNPYNRMPIPLYYMLQHHRSSMNWDETFTREEGQYAWDNWDAIRHHARADLQGIGYALDGRYISSIASCAVLGPTLVQSRYQQGVKLASNN